LAISTLKSPLWDPEMVVVAPEVDTSGAPDAATILVAGEELGLDDAHPLMSMAASVISNMANRLILLTLNPP